MTTTQNQATNVVTPSVSNDIAQTVSQVFGLNAKDFKNDPVHKPRENVEDWAKAYCRSIKPHKFTLENLNDLTEFDKSGFKDGPLYIAGPKGSGKSKTVEQYYARMGVPFFSVNAHSSLELFELIGSMAINNGNTVFQHGPLSLAAMCGGVLLIDEIDAAPPELLVSLHGILEMNDRIIIPENAGQIIHVQKGFRIIVTGNTVGGGDFSGEYAGTNILNTATLDRFNYLEWDYLSLEDEREIVLAEVPKMDKAVLDSLLKIAAESRLGDVEAISTRSLIRWTRKALAFRACGNLKKSFDRAIGFRLEPAKRKELYNLCTIHLGSVAFYGKEALENA